MAAPLHDAARQVLSRYPSALRFSALVPLGNRGGFSGAALWRAESAAGPLCLRAWPHPPPDVPLIHTLMTTARDGGLTFVPRVFAGAAGTVVAHAGCLWELTEWMPGVADFHFSPTPERLRAACRALARLHNAWARFEVGSGPCPAVRRRIQRLDEWLMRRRDGWQPESGAEVPVSLLSRAVRAVESWVEPFRSGLAAIAGEVRLQPCLCDVWHDHLLFEGDRLTGLIDYGAVKADHVSADLARMLGSLVRDDEEGWRIGLVAYRGLRPFSAVEEELARLLDRSGVVVGVTNWLRRLWREQRPFGDADAAKRRLGSLVDRVESWSE